MKNRRSTPPGIYKPNGDFLFFGENTKPNPGQQIATRARALGTTATMEVLPNPDPVLRKLGKSMQIYRDLRADSHVGGCIRRRKAAIKAMHYGLDRNQAERPITAEIAAMLADLDMERIISEILDAPLYGMQPLEIVWDMVGRYWVPVDVIGKPAEWFCFDDENRLRFKVKNGDKTGEPVDMRCFLLPRQDASNDNPYGQSDLSRCFWPTKFKQGGLDFWFRFVEKYGMPWLVGKTPRSSTDSETEHLLDMLEQMVQDAVAVIPDDASVEIVEAGGKGASADVFEKFLMMLRSEVTIALLGQNQATEASSTNASATAGLEVTEDIRDADAALCAATINRLVRQICEFNFTDTPPKFQIWEPEQVDTTLAQRDQILKAAGANLSNAYFARAYGLQPEDLGEQTAASAGGPSPFAFAESTGQSYADQAALDTTLDALAPSALQAQAENLLAPVLAAIQAGKTETELLGLLAEAYPAMDDTALVQKLTQMTFAADLWGRLSAAAERQD